MHDVAVAWGRVELMSVRDNKEMDVGPRALLAVIRGGLLVFKKKQKKKTFSWVSLTETNDRERLSAGWQIVLSCPHLGESLHKPTGLWESLASHIFLSGGT